MSLAIVGTVVSVGSAAYGAYSKNKAGHQQDQLNAANYQRSLEQYNIDLGFNMQQNAFAGQQEAFQNSTEAWGRARYGMAVADRALEVAYREEQVRNKKFAAQVDYKAQKHVADILQLGATEQASRVIEDVLRTAQGNKRVINVQSEKVMGTIVANQMSGIAQGASKDRAIIEAFQDRNRAMGVEKSKAKKSIIQVINQKNKVINDTNLQTAASYRGLEAIMKLKAAPVPHVPPPAPVFHGTAPIRPVGPAPIEGGNYVPYSSGATWAAAGANILGSSAGQSLYSAVTAPSAPYGGVDDGWMY